MSQKMVLLGQQRLSLNSLHQGCPAFDEANARRGSLNGDIILFPSSSLVSKEFKLHTSSAWLFD